MSEQLRTNIYNALDSIVLIDPHTHIDALNPASGSLADILGYHYYTELAHSAGLDKSLIEAPNITDRDKVQLLLANLEPIQNTIQYSWFIEMCQEFFGFEGTIIDVREYPSVTGKFLICDTCEHRDRKGDGRKRIEYFLVLDQWNTTVI